jgi:hypothetical protein
LREIDIEQVRQEQKKQNGEPWGGLNMLTAEQRYWQAVQKARLIAKFELKQFLEGKIDLLPCSGDRERAFIIAEIAKAMDGTDP